MLTETKKNYRNLADSHWVVAQYGDLAICLVTKWLKRRKDDYRMLDQYLKHQIPDMECRIYAACQKDFVLWRNLLYLRTLCRKGAMETCWCSWSQGWSTRQPLTDATITLAIRARTKHWACWERDFGGWAWPRGWWWTSVIVKSAISLRPSLRYLLWSPSFAQNLSTWCTLIMCPWKWPWALRRNQSWRIYWLLKTISHATLRCTSQTITWLAPRNACCTMSSSLCSCFQDDSCLIKPLNS